MVLYLLTTILLVILAYRMPCNGDYYEDAAKFADTYAEMIKRKKNGEMVMGLEEKKKKIPPYDSPLSGSRSKGNLLPPAFGISKRKERFIFFEMNTF